VERAAWAAPGEPLPSSRLAAHPRPIHRPAVPPPAVVDCPHGSCVTLTHHKRNRNPPGLVNRDTSTGLCLSALADPALADVCARPLVTCNHFDMDALLSAWTLMHPAEARDHAELLEATAFVGDYRMVSRSAGAPGLLELVRAHGGDWDAAAGAPEGRLLLAALRLNCWMNAAEREFSAPYEMRDTVPKFDAILPRVAGALAAARAGPGSRAWGALAGQAEYDVVVAQLRGAARGGGVEVPGADPAAVAAAVEEARAAVRAGGPAPAGAPLPPGSPGAVLRSVLCPALGLALVVSNVPLHYYSLFSAAHVGRADAVASLTPSDGFELEMAYTQYTNVRSRRTAPRLDLAVLAGALNARDPVCRGGGSGGLRWGASPLKDT